MLVLTIRTDKPEAEVGLYADGNQLGYEVWHAHRTLSSTLLQKIDDLLAAHGYSRTNLQAIICFSGPGSFTGLRIGITVADTLAYGLGLPVVGIEGEERWIDRGHERLSDGDNDRIALPAYGAPVHITVQKK
jgi:tRNA threonylcarbamoyladenosine biosynthesis protein TsaB